MSNLTKFEFVALDVEIHLDAMNLGAMIKEGNQASLQDRVKALVFLCYHFHESLKNECLTVNDHFLLHAVI